jgi:hypothetical protein
MEAFEDEFAMDAERNEELPLELQSFTLDHVKGKEMYRCKHCFYAFSGNTSITRLRYGFGSFVCFAAMLTVQLFLGSIFFRFLVISDLVVRFLLM